MNFKILNPKNIIKTIKTINISRDIDLLEEEPLVSVVIATYNWGSALNFAIKSVLHQTYQNFEIIVVGDGCTDNTAEVISKFNDSRIQYFNLEENSGSQSIPNNFGLIKASGEFIAYLGHDDIWLTNHLNVMVKKMISENAQLAFGGILAHGPKGSHIFHLGNLSLDTNPNSWHAPSCAMHTSQALTFTGLWRDFRELDLPPDVEFFSRFISANSKLIYTDIPTVLKFPSAWNRNSYIEKLNKIQRVYYQRQKLGLFFVIWELIDFWRVKFIARPENNPISDLVASRDQTEKGWVVHMLRSIRGLDRL